MKSNVFKKMRLKFLGMFVILCGIATLGFCKTLPDSAGVVPRPKGLAYGGIPYGSISGQLSLYFGEHKPIILPDNVSENEIQLL